MSWGLTVDCPNLVEICAPGERHQKRALIMLITGSPMSRPFVKWSRACLSKLSLLIFPIKVRLFDELGAAWREARVGFSCSTPTHFPSLCVGLLYSEPNKLNIFFFWSNKIQPLVHHESALDFQKKQNRFLFGPDFTSALTHCRKRNLI